jgi:hypothetical protein
MELILQSLSDFSYKSDNGPSKVMKSAVVRNYVGVPVQLFHLKFVLKNPSQILGLEIPWYDEISSQHAMHMYRILL